MKKSFYSVIDKFKNVIILVNVILMISDGVGKVSVNILLVGFLFSSF